MKSDVIGLDKNSIIKKLEYMNTKIIIDLDLDYSDEYNEDKDCKDLSLELEKINLESYENEDDIKLKEYIDSFTNTWNNTPKEFYETINDKKCINLEIKANELQLQIIKKYLETMNIEFKINN